MIDRKKSFSIIEWLYVQLGVRFFYFFAQFFRRSDCILRVYCFRRFQALLIQFLFTYKKKIILYQINNLSLTPNEISTFLVKLIWKSRALSQFLFFILFLFTKSNLRENFDLRLPHEQVLKSGQQDCLGYEDLKSTANTLICCKWTSRLWSTVFSLSNVSLVPFYLARDVLLCEHGSFVEAKPKIVWMLFLSYIF